MIDGYLDTYQAAVEDLDETAGELKETLAWLEQMHQDYAVGNRVI